MASPHRSALGIPRDSEGCDLLYVTHRVPFPPDKGDRIRTYHTLRFLAQRHRVHLACLADEPVSAETRTLLERLCVRVAIVPTGSKLRWLRAGWSLLRGGVASIGAFRSAELSRTLQSWVNEQSFHVALASASSVAPYLRAPQLQATPAIVDLVDVDSQKWQDYAEEMRGPKRWLYRHEAQALRRYEQEIARWARAVLLVSEAESELFRGIAPQANVQTVTNGVNLDYFHPSQGPVQDASCVFVGALDYFPNIDAVQWFVTNVWPAVRQRVPHASFRVVGRKPVPSLLALHGQHGVEIVGQVADVRPPVAASAVVVAPLRIARGLQNKVLEALAMAKPTVAGPPALAGFPAAQTPPVVCARTTDDWVAVLTRLFADSDERASLADAGRQYVEGFYHWDRCLAPLQEIIEQAISTGTASPAAVPSSGHTRER